MQPSILYADARFVVLDKPAGLPSHPGPRGGPSAEDCFPMLSRRRDGPWLAHRLDTDTSGCLLIALRKAALIEAQAAFASGLARKTYWAVVRGRPCADSGVVDAPLRKVSDRHGWRMVTGEGGAAAITEWRLLGAADGLAWLELRPRTGRTHQVRAHCAALGCPLLGDPIYGAPIYGAPNYCDGVAMLQLLARSIALSSLPEVTAPVPEHMAGMLRGCGYLG